MSVNKELMKGSTATLILTVLSKGECYGYEIIKDLEKSSEGLFELKEGTLYPILHGLEADGFVSARWVGKEGTRQRKYYTITKTGRTFLKEKKEEWAQFKNTIDRIVLARVAHQEGV